MTDAAPTPPTPTTPAPPPAGWRGRLNAFVESDAVQRLVIVVILVNAITLGLETAPSIVERWGTALHFIDHVCLVVFCIEIALKLLAVGGRFFTNGWNVFDLIVVAIALVPATGPFSVLRSLRVLRVLRMLSVVPSMRLVVGGFLHAVPRLGAVVAVLALFTYVAAVLAVKLFGATDPEHFGTLGGALFTLFQVMTMEGWADIARGVMGEHPWAWIYFLVFILMATFTVLNLFIGIIVNSMQEMAANEEKEERAKESPGDAALLDEIERLEGDLKTLKERLKVRLAKD